MNELVQFLRERLDEDERIARGATHHEDYGAWTAKTVGEQYGRTRWAVFDAVDDCVVSDVDAEGTEPEGVACHLAAWDPARVLAEVEAKRQLLALYVEHERMDRETFEAEGEHARSLVSLRAAYLDAVRHHAAVYADHPAFKSEWRP